MNHRRFLILTCFLLCTPFARADDAEISAVHDVIRVFVTSLLKGDATGAKEVCTDGAKNKQVIEAMADEYRAQRDYCEIFKQTTGFGPTTQISIERAMNEKLDVCAVDFGNGVAHSFWGGYSLRKVDGKWKIEFAEYDFDRALTGQLELLRSRPQVYRKGIQKLNVDKEARWWVAESNFCSMQWDFEHEKYKELLIEVNKIVAERAKAGVQGSWQTTIRPAVGDHPLWTTFRAKLTIVGDKLLIDSPVPAIRKNDRLWCDGNDVHSATWGFGVEQEWSLHYIRILGEIHSTFTHKHGDEIDVYEVIGIRPK